MGSEAGRPDEAPPHRVLLPAFEIFRIERENGIRHSFPHLKMRSSRLELRQNRLGMFSHVRSRMPPAVEPFPIT